MKTIWGLYLPPSTPTHHPCLPWFMLMDIFLYWAHDSTGLQEKEVMMWSVHWPVHVFSPNLSSTTLQHSVLLLSSFTTWGSMPGPLGSHIKWRSHVLQTCTCSSVYTEACFMAVKGCLDKNECKSYQPEELVCLGNVTEVWDCHTHSSWLLLVVNVSSFPWKIPACRSKIKCNAAWTFNIGRVSQVVYEAL